MRPWSTLLAISLGLAIGSPAAAACSIVYGRSPERALIDASSSVVIGRVEGLRDLPSRDDIPYVEATIITLATIKGRPPETFKLQRAVGSDAELDCPRSFPFLTEGTQLLFFLTEVERADGGWGVVVLEYYPPYVLLLPHPVAATAP